MSRDETFLHRWIRRKSEAKQEIKPVVSPETEEFVDIRESARDQNTVAKKPEPAIELPPIDSLDKESDFTVFMQEGVPEALKQQALRKLWASDPAFAAPDLLDIHALDYSHLGRTQEVVQTSYQVGKGFVDAVEKAAKETGADHAAEAEPGAAIADEAGGPQAEPAKPTADQPAADQPAAAKPTA